VGGDAGGAGVAGQDALVAQLVEQRTEIRPLRSVLIAPSAQPHASRGPPQCP
jgi:hypothetical protein